MVDCLVLVNDNWDFEGLVLMSHFLSQFVTMLVSLCTLLIKALMLLALMMWVTSSAYANVIEIL